MRYSASEKLEIIRLVEQSHLPVRRTLGQIGIPIEVAGPSHQVESKHAFDWFAGRMKNFPAWK